MVCDYSPLQIFNRFPVFQMRLYFILFSLCIPPQSPMFSGGIKTDICSQKDLSPCSKKYYFWYSANYQIHREIELILVRMSFSYISISMHIFHIIIQCTNISQFTFVYMHVYTFSTSCTGGLYTQMQYLHCLQSY